MGSPVNQSPSRVSLRLSDEEGLDDDFSSVPGAEPNSEFLNFITAKVNDIHLKLNETRSLTRANKEHIIKCLRDITKETEAFCAKNQPCSPISREQNIVSEIKTSIKEEFSKLKDSLNCVRQPTYAEAAKNTPIHRTENNIPAIPSNKPAIIVSSNKNVTTPSETLDLWKKNITFKDTNFSPSSIKFVSNNKLRIEFDDPIHLETTLKKVNQTNSEISAEPCKKLKPMIILKGVSNEIPTDQLTDIIINQNDIVNQAITDKNDLKFRFKRTNKNEDLYNAIFIASPTVWRAIIKSGKLNIDHQRVSAVEYVPLLQCYNCLQFGHTRSKCTREATVCSHCASLTHIYKDCPFKSDSKKINCYNCVMHSKKYKLQKIQFEHGATSSLCPRVTQMTERTRNRIDYG